MSRSVSIQVVQFLIINIDQITNTASEVASNQISTSIESTWSMVWIDSESKQP